MPLSGSSVLIVVQTKIMQKIYVGIDISKDWLDVAVCDQKGHFLNEGSRFDNSKRGIEKALRLVNSYSKESHICFENTGNYGLLLTFLIEHNHMCYSVIPPIEIKRSIGLTRGKSDVIDAHRIALYAATHHQKLQLSRLNSMLLLKIRHMLRYRNQLVDISKKLKCSLKSFQVSLLTVDVSNIVDSITHKLAEMKADIKQAEKEIEELIESDRQLAKNHHLAKSVRGIGPVISAYMLVYTNNYQAFDNPRKFNCYAGLAPFESSSGSSIRGRTSTSHLRHKKIKALLFNAANSATLYDKQLKSYYKRKTAEGKHRMLILNAIAAKIVYRVFAVIKRQSPYIEFAQ